MADILDPLLNPPVNDAQVAPPEGDGTGFYRGEGETVGPTGQDPNPAVASGRGMPLSDPVDLAAILAEQQRVVRQLLEHSGEFTNRTGVSSGTTDVNGNLALSLFLVPSGLQFVLTRVLIEASGYTPAAPYTGAAAYMILCTLASGRDTTAPTIGQMRDFGPESPGSGLLPGLFSDGKDTAPLFRGPVHAGLYISGGPTSTQIVANWRGLLARNRGVD